MDQRNHVTSVIAIEAPDSITDGARGLVGKRGDIVMHECCFYLDKKFGKMITKIFFYFFFIYLIYIFSSIIFCVRTLVFFIIEENRIF